MRSLLAIAALLLACEPDVGRDPKYVHGEVAQLCGTAGYVPPDAGALVDVMLQVDDTMQEDFLLQALCVRLDGAVLLLTNATEISKGHGVSGHIKMVSGEHKMDVVGLWKGRGEITSNYKFEVHSSHTFDASRTPKLHVTAYETGQPALQDRPRLEWKEGD
jgi:hypothetical protein